MPAVNDRRNGEVKFLPPAAPRYKVKTVEGKKYIIDTHTGAPVLKEELEKMPKTDEAVKGWVGPGTTGKSGPIDVATYLNMKAESKGK